MTKLKISLFITVAVLSSAVYSSLSDAKEMLSGVNYLDPNSITFSSIEGGATNQNYVASIGDQKYFVREVARDTGMLLNTNQHEYDCIEKTSSIGLSPPLICYDLEKGVIFTQFIEPHTAVDFNDSKVLKDCLNKIRQLHSSKIQFLSTCNPIDVVKKYYRKANKLSVSLPSEFEQVIMPFIEKFSNQYSLPQKLVPCHLDLHSGNIIINNQKVWLIDWEYSSMSDPLFDLAILAAQENFTPNQEKDILIFYCESYSTKINKKYHFMRILADARWAIWCFLQKEHSTLDYPYAEEGNRFVSQCMHYITLFSDLSTCVSLN